MAGNRPGVAQGSFRIDTSALQSAGRLIVSTAQQVGSAWQNTGRTIASGLDNLETKFRQTAGGLNTILATLGGAGIVARGVAASQQVARLNALMVTFSGSTQKANERMAQLRKIANDTGQSFLDVAEGANAILPAVGRNNVDLGKTLSLVQRLALIDPAQGIEGAAFAVRELLGGTYTSLAARFELSKTQLKGLVDAAKGDPQKIIEGLDKLVGGLGVTEEKFKQLNASGANAFNRLRGVTQEALATAFTPFLNNFLIPAATQIGDFIDRLNKTNPALLQTLSVFAIAAAGTAPLFLALSQLITAYKTLKTVSSGGVGRVAGVGLAAAAGVGIGEEVATRLAKAGVRSGDLGRIAAGESAGSVLAERLNQIIVIVVKSLGEGAKLIAQIFAVGANVVKQAIELIVAVFKLGGSYFREAFGNVVQTIGTFLNAVSNLLSHIPGQEEAAKSIGAAGNNALKSGFDEIVAAGRQRTEALDRLARGIDHSEARSVADSVGQGVDNIVNPIVKGLAEFLFPPLQQGAAVAGDAMGQVAQKANPLTAALEANADKIRETNQKIAKINEDFDEESRKIDEQRRIAAAREEADNALRSGRQSRDQNLADARRDQDYYANRARELNAYYQQTQDAAAQFYAQQAQNLADFRAEDVRRAEDHSKRLDEIASERDRAVEDAASSLDAKAVLRAQQAAADKAKAENSSYDTETQRRNEDFQRREQQAQQQFAREQALRSQQFQQQLIQEDAQRNLQLQREAEDRAIRAADEAQDRAIRLKRLQEDNAREDAERVRARNKQINDLRLQLLQETDLGNAFVQNAFSAIDSARSSMTSFFNFLRTGSATLAANAGAPAPATSGATPTNFAGGGRPIPGRPFRFNEYGLESALLNNGQNLALLSQPARILPADATRQLLSGRGGLTIGTFAPQMSFGDIGGYNPQELVRLIDEGTRKALGQFVNEFEGLIGA